MAWRLGGLFCLIGCGWLCTSMVQADAPGLSATEIADGWIALFDGETLFGWQAAAHGDWKVDDGAITVTRGDVGLLRTTTQFDQYILRLEFRSDPETNSGVFLRTSPRPTQPGRDCFEVNIAPPDNPFPTGSLVGQARYDKFVPDDGWHTFEVTMEAERVKVVLDGQTVIDHRGRGPRGRGYIGLQHNQGRAEFRHIRLKPLRLKPLYNGRDLAGWKTYPELASRFTVSDQGELHVQDGPGQLETHDHFADLVLQLACYVNGEHLNSGIFFRCIPGERMNGYESQIQNEFMEGDRHRPKDCGTGGIFRRVDARRVVADDHTWFYKTIIATGPHIAVWVNGEQVTDWIDERPPDNNPRRGLRLAAGSIMIQGHDPTTDLKFKNLAARELDERQWSAIDPQTP